MVIDSAVAGKLMEDEAGEAKKRKLEGSSWGAVRGVDDEAGEAKKRKIGEEEEEEEGDEYTPVTALWHSIRPLKFDEQRTAFAYRVRGIGDASLRNPEDPRCRITLEGYYKDYQKTISSSISVSAIYAVKRH